MYKHTLHKIMALLFILILSSCQQEPNILYSNADMVTCGNSDENEELYKLNEIYFNNEDKLTFRLHIVYFTNGTPSLDSTKLITTAKVINDFFNNNNANINFKVEAIKIIKSTPEEDSTVLPFIKDIERVKSKGKKIESIRKSYNMAQFKFWHTLFGMDDAINMYVFDNDGDSNVSGQAGGVGLNFFAIKAEFCNTMYNTAVHEISHCLGLLHIQTKDKTNGFSNLTGDGICDTPSSPSLLGLVDENCELKDHWEELVKDFSYTNEGNDYSILHKLTKEQFYIITHNVMGYANQVCRINFTEQQIRRMRKSIEVSSDLKKCIVGFEKYNLDFLNEIK